MLGLQGRQKRDIVSGGIGGDIGSVDGVVGDDEVEEVLALVTMNEGLGAVGAEAFGMVKWTRWFRSETDKVAPQRAAQPAREAPIGNLPRASTSAAEVEAGVGPAWTGMGAAVALMRSPGARRP